MSGNHTKKSIVIAGSLAQRPGYGGHTWALLQYVLGFRSLGWDVLFLDWLEPGMCVNSQGRPCPPLRSINVEYFTTVMNRFDLRGSYALGFDGLGWRVGLGDEEVLGRVAEAEFMLNVMGFLRQEDVMGSAQRRVFLDIDPGFDQMWFELGLHDPFTGHDDFVTIAENIHRTGCKIPDCGIDWIPTCQPIVLDQWPRVRNGGQRFTTVASWRGLFGPLEFHGECYGLRVHEFRKFLDLPGRSGVPFEVALDIHPAEDEDLSLLSSAGWELVDPRTVAGDPWSYRSYIQGSRAEFMVAKNMYVDTHGGWFSDRSICYLASGKPVLAQDTGFGDHYPTNEGLLKFSTMDEAAAAVQAIEIDYEDHCSSARAIAEEYFDSHKVLTRLINRLGYL